MHLSPKYINIIINILLGAAWAASFFGLISGIFSINGNIFVKLANGIIHFGFGLLFVLLIELIYLQFKKYEEQKETNRLLKKILEKES